MDHSRQPMARGAIRRRLGSFESAQAITNEHFPFNVVTVLGLENGPSARVLTRALAVLRDRHPLLRGRVMRSGRALEFELDDGLSIPLRVKSRTSADHWRELVEEELNSGFDAAAGPLLRVTCLVTATGEITELIITAQHAIFDATSGTHLLGELLSTCQALSADRPLEGFDPLPLTAAAEDYFPPPFRGWRGGWRKTRLIARQIGEEIAFRWHNRGTSKERIAAGSHCRIVTMELPRAVTGALALACRKKRVTVNSALCAAQLMVAMEDHPEWPALRNFVFVDLRPYLVPSLPAENLGSYFAMLRVTLPAVSRMDFWELARALGERVHAASKRGEKFASVLLSRALMNLILRTRSFRMGETALAYGGAARLDERFGSIRVTRLNAFVSNFVLGPRYTANARRFLGKLCWDMVYLDSDMDGAAAAGVAARVIERLTWAANPTEN